MIKRTCRGCKALERTGIVTWKCTWQYKTNNGVKPLEECKKPKTYNEHILLLKNKE